MLGSHCNKQPGDICHQTHVFVILAVVLIAYMLKVNISDFFSNGHIFSFYYKEKTMIFLQQISDTKIM
jgi:hypothetical protein